MKKRLWTSSILPALIVAIVTIVAIAGIIALRAPTPKPAQAQAVQAPLAKPAGPAAEAFNGTELIFLGNKNIAPVIYLKGTTPGGVAVDIVHALAKHMRRSIKISAMDWSEAQALVARGEADALIQINATEERKNIYDFSEPLLESHFSIFSRANTLDIIGTSSLRGLRVGVESGGLPHQVLGKDSRIGLTIIPDFLEGFRRLKEGAIDAVVVDYRVGSYVLAENGIKNIKVTGEPIESSYLKSRLLFNLPKGS